MPLFLLGQEVPNDDLIGAVFHSLTEAERWRHANDWLAADPPRWDWPKNTPLANGVRNLVRERLRLKRRVMRYERARRIA
jgi:hypothetical protein